MSNLKVGLLLGCLGLYEFMVRLGHSAGRAIGVSVTEIDASGRRMRLSIKAIQDAAERAEVRDYATRADAAAEGSGFGSLADKLRGAIGSRKP